MPTRKEMLEQIRETGRMLEDARTALSRLDPPADDELLRMFRVAAECLDELRLCVDRVSAGDRMALRRRSVLSH